jgi:primosomal protein N' (replication factor Y) (superfamily II helicase)
MSSIARVEPLTTARALRGPFDYRIPHEMRGIGVGSVLVVPFGRRRVLGLVVDVGDRSEVPPERLVEPVAPLESEVPPALVELGLWIAEAYCSTPARGLALVLPPGTGTGSRGVPAASTRELVEATLTPAGRDALRGAGKARLGPRQHGALAQLQRGSATASELSTQHGIPHATLTSLERRGLVTLGRRTIGRRPASVERGGAAAWGDEPPRRLTAAQEAALASVLDPLRERTHAGLLLHGVTGSGKTEVYLRAAEAALAQGRSAIVMVPEIALTPQTARRFEQRFGERVAILHSKLGLGERYDEWQRLRDGRARICVGPRSAVFAPLEDLGLVVVDEEHDSAYKQESDPRYDAREVAERRARAADAVLLCGTATPRAESWLRMRTLSLPERVDSLALPPVELLDMRGLRHALHPDARRALEDVRRRGRKAIVLVNRRGWSAFVECRECGRPWMCPHCDVTLTLHRDAVPGRLTCHHCGHAEPSPHACPDCGSTAVSRHGAGTQRVEAELREALAPLPVFRLDADAARRKHGIAETLERFATAPAGVLVGTQMVAQGHDFPEVELAVVQDADATLRFPDFRAEERTFSLVSQLAGRSGRGPGGGRVLVQTMSPQTGCLLHAAAHDANAFLTEEIERRRALSYPPFSTLIAVAAAAAAQEDADRATATVAAGLAHLDVLGPAPLFRLKDMCRSRLVVKATERAAAVAAVGDAVLGVAADRRLRGVKLSVDVDPQ